MLKLLEGFCLTFYYTSIFITITTGKLDSVGWLQDEVQQPGASAVVPAPSLPSPVAGGGAPPPPPPGQNNDYC